jgi:cytochrome b6-f complex iron-sulfur subunit
MKLCASSCLGITAMAVFGDSFAAESYSLQSEESILTIEKEKFVRKKKDEVVYKKFIRTTPVDWEYPLVIYRFAEDDYAALLMRCTHRGTELNINGDTLSCPAHDSEFSNRGEVMQGPADEALKTFKITTDEQNIYIHLA